MEDLPSTIDTAIHFGHDSIADKQSSCVGDHRPESLPRYPPYGDGRLGDVRLERVQYCTSVDFKIRNTNSSWHTEDISFNFNGLVGDLKGVGVDHFVDCMAGQRPVCAVLHKKLTHRDSG